MRAIIIAGGQGVTDEDSQKVRLADLVIGADGGAARALAWGLVPHVVIGDLDSLPDAQRADLTARGCRFVVHPRAKDETDLELALTYAVHKGAQEILVLGALGGRIDHTLANILLLALPGLSRVPVRIVAGRMEVRLIRGGEATTLEGEPGDLVSLLPLGGEASGVTTTGLVWPLCGETLRFGFTRGISNEMVADAADIQVETRLPGGGP